MAGKPIKTTGPTIPVRQSLPIKFKDKEGRRRITIHLKSFFGFVPETLIIEKIPKKNNVIRVSAVLTEEELKNEKKRNKESRKKGPGVAKSEKKVSKRSGSRR